MPNKTADIEMFLAITLESGPLTLAEIKERTPVDDPRWIHVALVHMRRAGGIRYVGCDADHNHTDDCMVELIAR